MMTYGIGMPPLDNKRIARMFGLTTERIRQIREEALRRLRITDKSSLGKYV